MCVCAEDYVLCIRCLLEQCSKRSKVWQLFQCFIWSVVSLMMFSVSLVSKTRCHMQFCNEGVFFALVDLLVKTVSKNCLLSLSFVSSQSSCNRKSQLSSSSSLLLLSPFSCFISSSLFQLSSPSVILSKLDMKVGKEGGRKDLHCIFNHKTIYCH